MGETWVLDLAHLAEYYGDGTDELHLAFNFPFALAPLDTTTMRAIVDQTEALIPAAGWPVWTFSNHDIGRVATRTCGGDPAKVRCALMMLLALRGTPVLYYGDELGLPDMPVPADRVHDHSGRDRARTPMPWSSEAGGRFTGAGVEPWLPLGDVGEHNVADQRADRNSVLTFTHDVIALRRDLPELRDGGHEPVDAPDGVWAWRRGRALVAVNLSGRVEAAGTLRIGTSRARDGEPVDGTLRLGAWEGAVVEATAPPGGAR
jgi:alpha-glucosidase